MGKASLEMGLRVNDGGVGGREPAFGGEWKEYSRTGRADARALNGRLEHKKVNVMECNG